MSKFGFFSSTCKAAGIPDFRSPTSGMYKKLKEFQLPYPEVNPLKNNHKMFISKHSKRNCLLFFFKAVFELDYFKKHPGKLLRKRPKCHVLDPLFRLVSFFINDIHILQSRSSHWRKNFTRDRTNQLLPTILSLCYKQKTCSYATTRRMCK